MMCMYIVQAEIEYLQKVRINSLQEAREFVFWKAPFLSKSEYLNLVPTFLYSLLLIVVIDLWSS